MNLAIGDKVKQIKAIKDFDFVGKIFTVTMVKEDSVNLRYDGSYKNLYPFAIYDEKEDKNFQYYKFCEFEASKRLFENIDHPYFEMVHIWTPWRKLKDSTGLLTKYFIEEAVYKTNRKTIFVKINGKKVKVTCHKNDIFDLDTGLNIGINRWIEKYCGEVDKEAQSQQSPINFKEVNCNLLDMPIYYHIAHCVSTDYNLAGFTARTIDECYDMKNRFNKEIDDYEEDEVIGQAIWIDNVFNLVTNKPYKKMTMDDLRHSVKQMAEYCAETGIIHLAIPHFGCRNNNLQWEDVKTMIIEEFTDVYMEFGWTHSIEIVACDKDMQGIVGEIISHPAAEINNLNLILV